MSRIDVRQLVSPELLGQLKVRRALLHRAVQRVRDASPEDDVAQLLELLASYDASVASLVELLSLDTPTDTVETRPRSG